MLSVVGHESLEALMDAAVPGAIRTAEALGLAAIPDEAQALGRIRELAQMNEPLVSLIGCGYYSSRTPNVIQRNVLENPAWYTAYTPVPAGDLPGPAGGAAELPDHGVGPDRPGPGQRLPARRGHRGGGGHDACARRLSKVANATTFFVDARLPPPGDRGGRDPGRTARHRRSSSGDPARGRWPAAYFGVLLAYPGSSGAVPWTIGRWSRPLTRPGAVVCVTADLLACTLLTPPGEWGADIVVGSAQRFGVPLGYGGPHAGFMAVTGSRPTVPARPTGGRVGGRRRAARRCAWRCRPGSSTSAGRRPPPTSVPPRCCWRSWPPCTPPTTGRTGLVASPVGCTASPRLPPTALRRRRAGRRPPTPPSTPSRVRVPGRAEAVVAAALAAGLNLRPRRRRHRGLLPRRDHHPGCSSSAGCLGAAFGVDGRPSELDLDRATGLIPEDLRRTSTFLTHPTFHRVPDRDRDAALPAPPGRRRPGAGPDA